MDITYLIIDDLNNVIEPNEHLSDEIRVLLINDHYVVFENFRPIHTTTHISYVLEFLYPNYIIKMEVDQ